ncbi:MAG: AraC family transcriptional regulator [Acidobacteriota bacterium]
MSLQRLVIDTLDRILRSPLRHVYVCGRLTSPPLLSHVVNFARLELPLQGRYEMEIERAGKPTLIAPAPGDAVFAPPNCWNRPTWRHPVRVIAFLFGRRQIGISVVTARRARRGTLRADKLALPQPLGGPAEKVLAAMIELQPKAAPHAALPDLVRALLFCLRDMVAEPSLTRKSKGRQLMDEICGYLQHNYQHVITRDSAAAEFGISPNHLSRLFRVHGSMKFCDYLAYVRVDRAKYLLKTYRLRVEEVARQCGYRDPAYFCRVFKKITRRTPGDYRQAI